tara:strand:+ start:433 stop:630 length:198 start_codon:yes stop_codon:yes gene_type:complete
MHMINNAQKRAFHEILTAASDMLDLMDTAPPEQWDDEWRQAVRESLDTVGLILKQHNIYLSTKGE